MLALVAMALLAPYLPLSNPIRMNVPKRFSRRARASGSGRTTSGGTCSAGSSTARRFSLTIGGLTILLAGVPGSSSVSSPRRRRPAWPDS